MLSNASFIIRAVSLVEKKERKLFDFFSYSGEAQSIEKSICYEASEQIWDGKLDNSEETMLELNSFCVVMELLKFSCFSQRVKNNKPLFRCKSFKRWNYVSFS